MVLCLSRYLLFMKMAALQLMQQKANKESNKIPAITEASEISESNNDTTKTQSTTSVSANPTEVSKDNNDKSTLNASQAESNCDENSTTNGPLDASVTQNGECKSPLESTALEESIPGLAQAKELAETLVADDGSGIGMFENIPKTLPGQSRGGYTGG